MINLIFELIWTATIIYKYFKLRRIGIWLFIWTNAFISSNDAYFHSRLQVWKMFNSKDAVSRNPTFILSYDKDVYTHFFISKIKDILYWQCY